MLATLIEIGSDLLDIEVLPEAIGPIPHYKKFELLTHTTVTRIMEDYPPPLGLIPELVSTSPYFDFAELVIIPVWR